MKYDIHYLLHVLKDLNPKILSVIPATDGKFFALSLRIWIGEFKDKNGKTQTFTNI